MPRWHDESAANVVAIAVDALLQFWTVCTQGSSPRCAAMSEWRTVIGHSVMRHGSRSCDEVLLEKTG